MSPASTSAIAPSSFTVRLVAGILALNLIIGMLVALTLYESRTQHEEQALATTQNLSRLLEQDLGASFDKIDLALLSITDEMNRLRSSARLDTGAINAFIERQAARLPEISNLRQSDVQGNLRYGTRMPSDRLVNIADREHFIHLRDHPDAGLFISKPVVSYTTGKWQIVLSRRQNQADGSFAGTVDATFELNTIVAKFAALNIGRNGNISLRDTGMTLVTRYPDNKTPVGQGLISSQFEEQFRASPEAGNLHLVYPIDHIERALSYRKIDNYPFYVIVSLSAADYLSGWWAEVVKNGALLAIFALVTLWFSMWMAGSAKRREAHLELIKQQERKFRTLLESSPDPLVIVDAQGQIALINRQVVTLFGYEPEELVGQPVEVLLPQRYHGSHVALRQAYTQAPQMREMGKDQLLRAVTKQGREVPVSVSVSPIQTEDGLMVAASIRDITEHKRFEDSLRTSTERLNEAQRIAQVGSWTLDLGSGHLIWSDEIFRLFEIDAERFQATYAAFLGAIHPEDRDAVNRAYTESLVNHAPYEITHRLLMPDGRVKWVHERCVTEFDAAGKPLQSQGTIQDISARKATEEQIEFLAYHDAMTGLPNRLLLLDRLQQALVSSERSARHGALLFLDLDNFKTINDTLGHDKGDLLLQQVGQRLITCVRVGDTVARLGGDEFVVLFEGLSEHPAEAATQTETLGEKILAALNHPYLLAGHESLSTPSIGVTLFNGHRTSIEQLLKQADLAMYQSKAVGRNTLRFFDPQMQAIVTNRVALEADLREAVKRQQFILHYQPQVTSDGRLTGAEALVRWQHPQRGMVSPAEFIPLAEETNLILPLGQWVLETACAQLAAWAAQPDMAHLTMAVNVSANQLRQADFVDQVLAVLDSTGANPKTLKLELTESLLVSNVETTIVKMSALKAHGVGFSLDDFGTGYSSLSYLKRLPLDQLKIDQGFVRDILIDHNDAAIAKMIVSLAKSMGLAVIAEGVETEAQRSFLASHGCHAYQGYLFSRPLPLQAFEAFACRV